MIGVDDLHSHITANWNRGDGGVEIQFQVTSRDFLFDSPCFGKDVIVELAQDRCTGPQTGYRVKGQQVQASVADVLRDVCTSREVDRARAVTCGGNNQTFVCRPSFCARGVVSAELNICEHGAFWHFTCEIQTRAFNFVLNRWTFGVAVLWYAIDTAPTSLVTDFDDVGVCISQGISRREFNATRRVVKRQCVAPGIPA